MSPAITAETYILFAIVNFVVWPGFAALYWFTIQRAEEDLIETMSTEAEQQRQQATEG